MLLAKTGGASAEKLYVDDVFSTYLYTGNGSTQTITNGIDLAGKGGLVWAKGRSLSGGHELVDTVRGAGYALGSDITNAQSAINIDIEGFNSNGFYLNGTGNANYTGMTVASWTFRKAPKFFDVQTKSHTNGVATNITLTTLGTVGQVIAKITNTTGDWIVWHRSLTAGNNLRLNTTAAQTTTNAWLSVSSTTATLSASAPTGSYVVYAFAHDTAADGIIQCGSCTGDAQIPLGWEPQYLLVKPSSTTGSWQVFDSMRGWTADGYVANLTANTSNAENATGTPFKPNATGFKPAHYLSETYIYIAIRRPNKPPTSGTQVYNAIARTGTGAAATVTGVGFAPDACMSRIRNGVGGSGTLLLDRLRGISSSGGALILAITNAEQEGQSAFISFDMTGATVGTDEGWNCSNSTDNPFITHFFRRAPGFFDQVCYSGTGLSFNVNHSLSTSPELIITKRRDAGDGANWGVWYKNFSPTQYLYLNSTNAISSNANVAYAAYDTYFTVGYDNMSGTGSSPYIAYLFATLPGISKVGSYTGNGSSQTVNCGFSAGARFILIKRTDSTGDWYVWDSARGIVAANDPHLSLNTVAAEVTTDDSVDPANSGFIVNQVAATNINVTSATYIYLAIA